MGPWCSWLNIPSLQDGDAEYNVGSNPTGPTKNRYIAQMVRACR